MSRGYFVTGRKDVWHPWLGTQLDRKSQNLYNPLAFNASVGGLAVGISQRRVAMGNLEWLGYNVDESITICSIQYWNVTTGLTDCRIAISISELTVGHGSNRSTDLDGSHGSWVSIRDLIPYKMRTTISKT